MPSKNPKGKGIQSLETGKQEITKKYNFVDALSTGTGGEHKIVLTGGTL